PTYRHTIDPLRGICTATAVAAGNNGWTTSMATPGCISSAVSVGSTANPANVSWFSNATSSLQLLAPGKSILSSVPGGDYMELNGTSMATPHVAGSRALLKPAVPPAGADAILNA